MSSPARRGKGGRHRAGDGPAGARTLEPYASRREGPRARHARADPRPSSRRRKANAAIFAGAAVVFAAALYLVRSQATVDDVSWMRAMIPHHSIAILTSERARISDPRVRALADQIIESQRREIDEMERLLDDLEHR